MTFKHSWLSPTATSSQADTSPRREGQPRTESLAGMARHGRRLGPVSVQGISTRWLFFQTAMWSQAGTSRQLGGTSANNVARWNGTAWSAARHRCKRRCLFAPRSAQWRRRHGWVVRLRRRARRRRHRPLEWNRLVFDGHTLEPQLQPAYPGASGAMPNGDIVACGNITLGPGPTGSGVVRWDGTSWSSSRTGRCQGNYRPRKWGLGRRRIDRRRDPPGSPAGTGAAWSSMESVTTLDNRTAHYLHYAPCLVRDSSWADTSTQ